ncbi:MAG: SAM-dependent methyltransferase, partial [Polyangiaceae bacterium]
APGPMAFADSTRLATILAEAGFDDILIAPFDADFVHSENGLDGAVEAAMRIGPAARLFAEASQEARLKMRSAMEAALAPFLKGNVVAMPAATWIVQAKNEG